MLQFLVGMIIGVIFTIVGISVWAVFEEEKENKKREKPK